MNPSARLLRLPPSSRYAVSAALCLAALPDGEHLMAAQIARRTGLSPSYLAKILPRLALGGILDSRRGARGGYRLSRAAGDVTLAEIVAVCRHLEDGPSPCLIEARPCDGSRPCAMHRFVARTEEALRRRLEKTTLLDVAGSLHLNSGQAESE